MRKCLEILSQNNCRVQVITKSSLVTRDIDLLKKTRSIVSLTITTDSDEIAKTIEPHAPSPSARLKAVETLIANDIPTSVRIDPIIPFLNDKPEQLIKTLAQIGIKHITSSTYKAKPDNWQRLSTAMPAIAEKLKPLYFEKGEKTGRTIYLPKNLRFTLMKNMRDITEKYGMKFGTCREGLSYLNTATCDGSWLLNAISQQPLFPARSPFFIESAWCQQKTAKAKFCLQTKEPSNAS
jgi:DNA repair photolyase